MRKRDEVVLAWEQCLQEGPVVLMRRRFDPDKPNFHNTPKAFSSDYKAIETYRDFALKVPCIWHLKVQNMEILYEDMGKVALRRGGIYPPYPKDMRDEDFSGISPPLSVPHALADIRFASDDHSLR